MTRGLVVAVAFLLACGHPAPPPVLVGQPQAPRLLPPAPIDPKVRGAAYLTSVALQLQPGWGQFLDDCRLRLPVTHPLNQMQLAATVELVIDRTGKVVDIAVVVPSGNADFDRAVHDAIADATPVVAPPLELLSDDDRAHLRWLFARDRRQAGPATAEVVRVELPIAGVIARLVAAGDLARAARRIAIAPAGPERADATAVVMVAALREALGSADGSVRRAAVEAIARAHVSELAGEVRALLEVTSDAELRVTAMAAAGELGDREAVAPLLVQLPADLAEHPRLAIAETRALVRLGHVKDAAAAIRKVLDSQEPSPIALEAFALAPTPELARDLGRWFQHGNSRTRAAVCAALGGTPPDQAVEWLGRGLRDADATVRANCTEAATRLAITAPKFGARLAPRLRELAGDRDRAVRALAIAAIAAIDPSHLVDASGDSSAEVRAAYARALATAKVSDAEPGLRALIDDRDPDVRAAAWLTLAAEPVAFADRARLALRAVNDPAPQVRLAAVGALDDDDVLAHLAAGDDSPELRTVALVQLAGRRGRAQITDLLLERLAAAAPGSADRVRSALAWLLAR
jgi:TonB family protein